MRKAPNPRLPTAPTTCASSLVSSAGPRKSCGASAALRSRSLRVRTGLSIRHVLLLEGGRVNEGFDTLCRLAGALDVGLDALFGRMEAIGGGR